MTTPWRTDQFDYTVPEEAVAQAPLEKREEATLFVKELGKESSSYKIKDLPKILPEGALLIFNDSQVLPARLEGKLTNGRKIEVFLLHRPEAGQEVRTFARPGKKLKVGDRIDFDENVAGVVVAKDGVVTIRFEGCEDPAEWVKQVGHIPLPPYIRRQDTLEDQKRYQTVYANAQHEGSVAAPTAGLHFSENLLIELRQQNIEMATVTLHVGAGTFMPVRADYLDEHVMHEEMYCVPSETLEKIKKAQEAQNPVIVVGTTSLRALESLDKKSRDSGKSREYFADQWWSTNLFLYPSSDGELYQPWCLDALMTNFHQPQSTLFMLVSAIWGLEAMKGFYQDCLNSGCRLFSYGDSSLLWKRSVDLQK
ncbi:MAG: tRNA preQ1(34) S-adenosylmethionine ribosyltransferase-isomerase QueA [Oligoflexales bacterium]